jgi:hypothetical protein
MPRVGIDYGGVIVISRKLVRGEDTGLAGFYTPEAAQTGVFDAMREIISICDSDVWIVYKAGSRMQERTRAWLDTVDCFSRSGLDVEHLRFCQQWEEKGAICQELGIYHFVDGYVHVIQILRCTVPHVYFFREQGGERRL